MKKGRIVKGISSFYYVDATDEIYECRARGKFKKMELSPLVGDNVMISIADEQKKLGIIEEVLERKMQLLRPPIANVDQTIIVFSVRSPEPDLSLLDKLTVLSEHSGLDIIVCLNKIDLDTDNEAREYKKIFECTGYKFIAVSTVTGEGIYELKQCLKDKVSVFCGPSGVGKSSILNAMERGMKLKTGQVSRKTQRGKHTTRHSELFMLEDGGYVVDTPGFTSLELDFIEPCELKECFPEFTRLGQCKFADCMHIGEPECVVKEAVGDRRIKESRYESYKSFLKLSINGGNYGTDSTIDTFSRLHKSGKGNRKR